MKFGFLTQLYVIDEIQASLFTSMRGYLDLRIIDFFALLRVNAVGQ